MESNAIRNVPPTSSVTRVISISNTTEETSHTLPAGAVYVMLFFVLDFSGKCFPSSWTSVVKRTRLRAAHSNAENDKYTRTAVEIFIGKLNTPNGPLQKVRVSPQVTIDLASIIS